VDGSRLLLFTSSKRRCDELTKELRLEIWGDMGRYGEIWGDAADHGAEARDMGRYGESWGSIDDGLIPPYLPVSPHISPYLPQARRVAGSRAARRHAAGRGWGWRRNELSVLTSECQSTGDKPQGGGDDYAPVLKQ